MNLIKKTAIALSLFAISGGAAIAQTKTPAKATKTETVKKQQKHQLIKKGQMLKRK
ncbi:hypothetical protein [Empedobacter sedimenti]|uniref:hypothetical protein n=1 Tax=Empedobacter sedimenti TaxID=3042610 RepID=UPI0024A72BAD|nr:hypothetical protein [Empedobacter sedimenti]